jgi:hypothetical protein
MSWFGKDFASLCASEEHCTTTDTQVDLEVADGVVVERRSVLWLSGAAVAAVLTGGLSAQDREESKEKKGSRPPQGKLDFAQFLEEIYPLARRQVDSKGQDEETYLMTVAAALSRVADPSVDVRKSMRAFRQKHKGDKQARFPVSAMAMRLQPGRGFSHHDHRDYNGVILGVAGECRIRNYDILGDKLVPEAGKTFQIRQTRDDLILPGRFSSLGRARDNVHELVAGKDGARVLDVFTFFEKGATSKYMDVEKKPRDADLRIFDAAWKPRRRRQGR